MTPVDVHTTADGKLELETDSTHEGAEYIIDLKNFDNSIAYYYQNLGTNAEVYSVHAIPTNVNREIEFKLKIQIINDEVHYTIGSQEVTGEQLTNDFKT